MSHSKDYCSFVSNDVTEKQTLKCGKYEVEAIGMKNGKYSAVCVDQMHSVTEKEWQNVMLRLRNLENKPVWHGFTKEPK